MSARRVVVHLPKYNKLIFVCMDNLCRSPMAEAIMKNICRDERLTVQSRGLIVLFSEPYNPKAAITLRNNGIIMGNGCSEQLVAKDFSEDTLILCMDRDEKNKLLQMFDKTYNVYTIMEYAGGSGDIFDPYGGDAEVYALFYESVNSWVTQVEHKIYEENLQ